ncbi:hypothetical protein [Hyphococcus sp.]|uniref:hypothetical protein n=1 Tax=Hyphococcus sp. TaxID=2038636 RepID=UPI003CCBBE55
MARIITILVVIVAAGFLLWVLFDDDAAVESDVPAIDTRAVEVEDPVSDMDVEAEEVSPDVLTDREDASDTNVTVTVPEGDGQMEGAFDDAQDADPETPDTDDPAEGEQAASDDPTRD